MILKFRVGTYLFGIARIAYLAFERPLADGLRSECGYHFRKARTSISLRTSTTLTREIGNTAVLITNRSK